MGRFTTGDIDYKFMVGVQSSRAADRFGYLGETIFYEDEDTKESFPVEIHYNFDKNYLKYVEEELENIKNKLSHNLEKINNFFNSRKVYTDEELAKFLNKTPDKITFENLQEFLLYLTKEKISERTQARGISSIKSFFKYLIEEEIREDNPSTLLEGPKLGLYLPDTLSFEDVEKIINAIDLSTDLGVRNHCIIEVLYGCGLRVSELIELKISDVNFKENFIKVEGKGKKVRYVPLANYTANLILNYINNVRANNKIGKKYEDHIFLNSRGSSMSRVIVFIIIKELVEKAGIRRI
jgi:integrase/recombinase XerD